MKIAFAIVICITVLFIHANCYKYQSKKNFEILEDFNLTYEYGLEKLRKGWLNRGMIEFKSKNSNKNYKSNAFAITQEFTKEERSDIEEECKKGGFVVLRVINGNQSLIASTSACSIVQANFKDKILFSFYGNIKQDSINSVSYEAREQIVIPDGVKRSKSKDVATEIDFVSSHINMGPIFPEEKEEKFSAVPPAEEKTFFQKYWWVMAIFAAMLIMKGPEPEGGAAAS